MKRKRLTRLSRVKIFGDGICCLCGQKIWAGQAWIIEHKKPLWLGGEDAAANMGPAHQTCATAKTSGEAAVKAKNDRQRAKHLGVKKRRGRPLPGTKASGLRRRMDGTVERW